MLLPPDARTLAVPRARDIAGGMGRYVWYAEGERHKRFLQKLFRFIQTDGREGLRKFDRKHRGGGGWQSDPHRRRQIEDAATREVKRYYEDLGYEIERVENEHRGWDLEATRDGLELHLEVKGIAGAKIAVELTANEFKMMKRKRNNYRVCIVTNALSKKPRLSIYGYVAESKRWEHHEDASPIQVKPAWVQTARLYVGRDK